MTPYKLHTITILRIKILEPFSLTPLHHLPDLNVLWG